MGHRCREVQLLFQKESVGKRGTQEIRGNEVSQLRSRWCINSRHVILLNKNDIAIVDTKKNCIVKYITSFRIQLSRKIQFVQKDLILFHESDHADRASERTDGITFCTKHMFRMLSEDKFSQNPKRPREVKRQNATGSPIGQNGIPKALKPEI